ncbi:MAG: SDR family NAD(P)-dependent oxidoreductase [Candidatus Eremiobacteraeota bacterium]|nr:SDR family NAD(P)-dependent oxidoreductase [Candidatus Eremiobacteraeota bacterium]
MIDISGSRILVIGGGGFIGSHVVDQLCAEPVKEIIVYDNFARGKRENLHKALKDERVSIFPAGGDIREVDVLNNAMKGIDYVIHLAALWLLQCVEYPRAAFDVNIQGTFNVLEGCVKHGVKKLVYSSSASVYGNALRTPMEEDHPYNNRTFYGATKIAGEQMARAFNDRYGLNYVGLRYMNVYGPRQDYKGAYVAVIMKMLDRIDENLPPVIFGDGSQTYDFISVEDTARANICALKAETSDTFYNVGSGTGTTVKEIAELLIELTGSKLSIQYEPQGQTFVTHRIGGTSKAAKEIGFTAKVALKEGLIKLIEWRKTDKERQKVFSTV